MRENIAGYVERCVLRVACLLRASFTGMMAVGLLLAVTAAMADENAEARFKGAEKTGSVRISNVTCKAAGADVAAVTFDIAWNWSWRAAWEVAPAQSGGADSLKVESWDAAWVFVKFRQLGDLAWSHATLAVNNADHTAPAGATLAVGCSDVPAGGGAGGQRGVGAFVYRAASGSGSNDWKGVTLRWQNGADGVADLGKVELKVLGIEMVYVPGGAFWAGDGSTNPVTAQFSVGGGTEPFRIVGEDALTLGGRDPKSLGNRDAVGMDRAEDFGEVTRLLPAAFPKGYAPFYCMKRQITQGQYVAFLNSLTAAQQQLYGQVGAEGLKIATAAQPYRLVELPRRDGIIRTAAAPVPAVYETDRPDVACAGMLLAGGALFTAWAGLRPMSELEYEKACRGPLKPVPNESAAYWGILDLSGPRTEYVVAVGNFRGRRFSGLHGEGVVAWPAGWPQAADGIGYGIRTGSTSGRGMMCLFSTSRGRGVRTAPGGK